MNIRQPQWTVLAILLTTACHSAAPPPRTVDIRAADGVVLKGTLFAAPSAGPAVLLLHQCDDHRTVWDPLGPPLAAAGITALSIDFRGYGDSGGTPHDKLPNAELGAAQTRRQSDGGAHMSEHIM